MAITPNMSLSLPTPTVTPGPAYASQNNTAFEVIDAHDHTSGNGVPIATAALNINGDLTFNSHNILDLNSLVLDSLSADPSSATTVYVKNGELFYIDDSAQAVQITDNGSVAGATGTIGGMGAVPPFINPSVTFSAANKDYTFNYQSSLAARMNVGDIRLYPFDGGTVPFTNFVTLASPDALGAQYTWTYPLAVPSKTSPLVWSGAGIVDDIELNDGQFLIGATAGAVAAGAIAGTANQVTVTNAANLITLALPQDIATTSSPTFVAVSTTTRFNAADGTAAAPSYRFTSDTNTGFYRIGADSLGVTTSGALVVTVDTSGIDVVGDIFASDDLVAGDSVFASLGAAASPSYSFTGDSNTGMYSATADAINFAIGGVQAINLDTNGLESLYEFHGPNGVATFPTYSFTSDQNTGMYRRTTDQIGFATGGTEQGFISSAGLTLASGNVILLQGSGQSVQFTGVHSGSALGAYGGRIHIQVDGTTFYVPFYN